MGTLLCAEPCVTIQPPLNLAPCLHEHESKCDCFNRVNHQNFPAFILHSNQRKNLAFSTEQWRQRGKHVGWTSLGSSLNKGVFSLWWRLVFLFLFLSFRERSAGGGGVPISGYLPGSVPGLELPWFYEKFPLTHDFFPTSLLPSKHIAL